MCVCMKIFTLCIYTFSKFYSLGPHALCGCSDSPRTPRRKLLGLPHSKSSPLFRAISYARESSCLTLSIFTEQSPSGVRPKRDVRPRKFKLTWFLSPLLKAVLRREKNRPPSMNRSRTSSFSFLPLRGARGVKEQGITTQEPTSAWTWSGTEGTGESARTLLHRLTAVIENDEDQHTGSRDMQVCYQAIQTYHCASSSWCSCLMMGSMALSVVARPPWPQRQLPADYNLCVFEATQLSRG